MPAVWGFYTAMFDEKLWPQEQMGDFLHPERFPDWPARYREQMQYKGFRLARLGEFVSNAEEDQGEEIEKVGQHPRPVLVIWGKQDQTVLFENSEWLMKLLPHGRLVAIDDCAHLPQWEQPGVMHPELIAFLSQ
jgi:pimeloyl-ACP methyl ester carboxylesterase